MQVLLDKGVDEGKILFLSLIAAPEGVHKICGQYPRVKVVTTEIDEGIAPDFQVIPGTHTSCTDKICQCFWQCCLQCFWQCFWECSRPLSSSSQTVQWAMVVHVLTNVALSAGVGEFGDRYFCD